METFSFRKVRLVCTQPKSLLFFLHGFWVPLTQGGRNMFLTFQLIFFIILTSKSLLCKLTRSVIYFCLRRVLGINLGVLPQGHQWCQDPLLNKPLFSHWSKTPPFNTLSPHTSQDPLKSSLRLWILISQLEEFRPLLEMCFLASQ